MVEIELSYTWDVADPALSWLVQEFSQQTGIKVRLRLLSWATAWVELFKMVSQGEGSDVSNIGSTWVSTLARLDALRPFKPDEVAQIGGPASFVPSSWQSTKLPGDPRTWSIPSLGWIYVIFYRKDLLQSIGIDPTKAFESLQAFQDTLVALKKSELEIPWLNPNPTAPYVDLIHTSAPWVWEAGGEFIDPAGNQVLFDSPQAISGFTNWLNTYICADKEKYHFLDLLEARDLVMTGRVAGGVMNINIANEIFNGKTTNIKKENMGFANPTNIPWTGGGSFVIWDHVQTHSERERAAIALVKFLSSKQANLRMMQEADLLPVRMDALEESYPPGNPLREPVMQAAKYGRSYYNTSHWRRVESQLSFELNVVLQQIRETPTADSASVIRSRLEPLARKLNAVLAR